MSNMEKKFEADTGKILDIVINSLYSEREIFVRELISNASDAIDKKKYLALTNKSINDTSDPFEIKIEVNSKENTIRITDNGIGMDEEDLINSLGTIARSGTKAFLEQFNKSKDDKKEDVNLIGQFGVGFYASFMVADKVEVLSKKAGTDKSWKWISDGKSGYNIEKGEKTNSGTELILHLKKDAKEFLEGTRIQFVVRKYSDHISYPVKMLEVSKKDAKEETINEASALWTRAQKDIKEKQYEDFFSHIGAGFGKPLLTMHNNTEGTVSYTNLLCIPSSKPFDLFNPDRKSSLKLYINRVFITDKCDNLIPAYLRFVKGIVDTQDIDLNVSREMLQNNPAVAKISKSLVGKILRELKKIADKDKAKYIQFWNEFGQVLKEGLYEDLERKDTLLELARFSNNENDDLISLEDYVNAMDKNQKDIYYIAADTKSQALSSPHLEGFKSKGIKVLVMADPIDQFWLSMAGKFKEKNFVSITQGEIDLDNIKSDKKDPKNKDTKKDDVDKKFTNLIAHLKASLGQNVKDIRLTSKLTDSPACLVADKGDMDVAMENLMKQRDPNYQGAPRILEINPDHNLIKFLNKIDTNDKKNLPKIQSISNLLLDQAKLLEGIPLDDSKMFCDKLNDLILESIK
mgnify:FL=1